MFNSNKYIFFAAVSISVLTTQAMGFEIQQGWHQEKPKKNHEVLRLLVDTKCRVISVAKDETLKLDTAGIIGVEIDKLEVFSGIYADDLERLKQVIGESVEAERSMLALYKKDGYLKEIKFKIRPFTGQNGEVIFSVTKKNFRKSNE